ncbi:CbtA family protein [Arthrobacter sp. AB6]|uniref:CbtA family protein n=1 Tax=Arthrobacter sp. AB6 TaxID=2962570 RepID=UPI0028811F18|nr:CbtA family protein [Arthrobacter sp. AB6]MDT0196690.1 CbtA family protein [Arthrobacter sp. AB6]
MNIKRLVTHGAWAGIASGVAGMGVLWLLVEPLLERAIALENGVRGGHEHGASQIHDHAAGVITRDEQLIGGLLTIFIAGVLLGVMFALTFRSLAPRLPGKSPFVNACFLAALGFISFALIPSLVLPANPPGVGDPATVEQRTLIYIAAIVCSVAIICACFAVSRAGASLPLPARTALAVATAVTGILLLITLLPTPPQSIPEGFPAELMWQFRLAVMAEVAAVWAACGLVFGWLMDSEQLGNRQLSVRTALGVWG